MNEQQEIDLSLEENYAAGDNVDMSAIWDDLPTMGGWERGAKQRGAGITKRPASKRKARQLAKRRKTREVSKHEYRPNARATVSDVSIAETYPGVSPILNAPKGPTYDGYDWAKYPETEA